MSDQRDPKIDEECALLLGWVHKPESKYPWISPQNDHLSFCPDFSSGSEECKRNVQELFDHAIDKVGGSALAEIIGRDPECTGDLFKYMGHSKFWKVKRDAAREALK